MSGSNQYVKQTQSSRVLHHVTRWVRIGLSWKEWKHFDWSKGDEVGWAFCWQITFCSCQLVSSSWRWQNAEFLCLVKDFYCHHTRLALGSSFCRNVLPGTLCTGCTSTPSSHFPLLLQAKADKPPTLASQIFQHSLVILSRATSPFPTTNLLQPE